MYILGVHGSPTVLEEESAAKGWPYDFYHEASAVLLKDGEVVAAVAQERIDRIKYSNAFPVEAIQFCLDKAGVSLEEVSAVAYASNEHVIRRLLGECARNAIRGRQLPLAVQGLEPRSVIADLLSRAGRGAITPEKVSFVGHHVSHAMASFCHSGFDSALLYVRDGWGDDFSGLTGIAELGKDIKILEKSPLDQSLGHFYLTGTQLIGYHIGDEYKMMGLAPFGDAERYFPLLKRYVVMTGSGASIDLPAMWWELSKEFAPIRQRNAPLEEIHQDIAAAFQKMLEVIALHELRYWRDKTNQNNVCCSGGVGQNCTLNGRILESGIFDRVFVPACPGDGGLALGAALFKHDETFRAYSAPKAQRVTSTFWGTDIADSAEVERSLGSWSEVLIYERLSSPIAQTARAIADGKVIGWVRGRAEFGPRALGNRSILADPRPVLNKNRINQIVKKREAFRPFAPSVIEEAVDTYFEADPQKYELGYMTFVVSVREQFRAALGAITHVDGSARIQSVAATVSPDYWALISEFGRHAGYPIILNTSLNNHAEPIVESVSDAIVCFLTTDLDAMVIGDFWLSKRKLGCEICRALIPYVSQGHSVVWRSSMGPTDACSIVSDRRPCRRTSISEEVFHLLVQRSKRPCPEDLLSEIHGLWCNRFISLSPFDRTLHLK